MITKVRLKNWRSHLESEFDFSSGTNALVGHLGSGKTTILDSICFALFGTIPTLQSKKLKLDDIIMKKPFEKNRAEIEVFFQLDGTIYSVKRIIEKGKGTTYSEFRENGNLIEAPSSQRVTELVEKTWKVNYELFSKAIYSEQNALDYFLTIPRGQRMKKIDKLLMIDKFEKARASAVTLTNRLIERKLGKQSIIEQVDLEELEENISELKNSLNQILSEKEKLSSILNEVGKEKGELEKEVNELQKIKGHLELFKREESGIRSAIEETKKSLQSLKEALGGKTREEIEKSLKELRQRTEGLEKRFRERQKSYEKISSFVSESKAKINFLKKEKIEKLEEEFEEKLKIKKELEHLKGIVGEDAAKQIEQRKDLYEKLIGEIQETRARIKDLDEIIKQLSSSEGKCPVCESRLTEEKKNALIKQKQEQIGNLRERLEKARKNKELSEQEIKKLEDAARKIEKMLLEIKDLGSMRTELENSKKLFLELSEQTIKQESQISELKREIEGIGKNLKLVTEGRQGIEILSLKQKDYEEKKRRFEELVEERKQLERKIAGIEQKIAGRNLAELENNLKGLIAREKEVETKIISFEQLIKEREGRVREYEAKLNETMKQRDEVQRLEKLTKDLKIFEKALEQTQVELRTEFIEAVNYTMNKLWSTLYPYQDFVGIELEIEEGDYLLKLKERSGRFVNVEGVASGGERSIACLALRIAFALTLAPNLQMLVLDEPTANLDSMAVKELATTLRERINEFITQTFLITHQTELEDAITGNGYRLERDKAKDGVTKVISIS